MSKVEGIRQRISTNFLPVVENRESLQILCSNQTPLIVDSTIQMCTGLRSKGKKNEFLIDGEFGLKKVDKVTGETVAVCGFDVENDKMVIRHTPQGNRPKQFSSSEVRNRFGRSDFRIEMMQTMIEIAKKLNLKGVIGFPIKPYLLGDMKRYDLKIKAKNKMFELFDFKYTENSGDPNDAYYYLDLTA
ncbi:MAG: hypothetical protein WC741_00540 [Patescibacteria group bacterium]|jgi:hypothetical protein